MAIELSENLVSPDKKRIVGVLDSMRVYLEVKDVWRKEGAVQHDHNHLKAKYHPCDIVRIYIDEDGGKWFADDLVTA